MATSKILYMKDCGKAYHGKHLKAAILYITDLGKTQQGLLIGGLNCQPIYAYEKMKATKERFGKIDKRQGYHLIISFQEGEVDADTAFEIIEKFVQEYLGEQYEAVYAVHDNTAHIHGHIVFNSVSCLDGKKYRYKKGDWAKEIQPITNKLCREYNISIIEIEDEKVKEDEKYQERNLYQDRPFVWSDMIRRDIDICILQAQSETEFLSLLKKKGYEIHHGKYMAIKPPGMQRFRRVKSLGDDYAEEKIRERIPMEHLSEYQTETLEEAERIIYSQIPYGKREKMPEIQKRYYVKLYRIGMLKRRPYSQAFKYRKEIQQLKKIQDQYLFLVKHDIQSKGELIMETVILTDEQRKVSSEKSRVYRERKKCESLFEMMEQMEQCKPGEMAYLLGDKYFEEEHQMWISLEQKLKEKGYEYEKVSELKEYFRSEIAQVRELEKYLSKKLKIANSILSELKDEERERVKQEKIRTLEQPKR